MGLIAAQWVAVLQAENAALKEQMARMRLRLDSADQKDTQITEQQSHIEALKAALVAVRDDLDLRMRISEDDSLNISNSVLDQMCDAIDIQSSDAALREHDQRVIANFLEREGKWMTNDAMLKEHDAKLLRDEANKRLAKQGITCY